METFFTRFCTSRVNHPDLYMPCKSAPPKDRRELVSFLFQIDAMILGFGIGTNFIVMQGRDPASYKIQGDACHMLANMQRTSSTTFNGGFITTNIRKIVNFVIFYLVVSRRYKRLSGASSLQARTSDTGFCKED
ncbi:MAG: hypothetical protein K8F30_01155 [Taibaiella sp.]|nr:hypothetical protein [Taibaiella sp.]